jgi:mannose-6-phosphate isomerase
MTVYPLTGAVRPYAWGSRTVLADLQGRPSPSEVPEAELWLGAHPGDPSTVLAGTGPVSLATLIADDPEGQLGAEVRQTFGPRLPYLLKVQADPTLPKNYTDAYHKPEMLVALTPFEALCGFRAPDAAADELASLGLVPLEPVVKSLRDADLRTAVETLLSWPRDDRRALIASVVAAGASPLASRLAAFYPDDPGVLVALLLNHVRLRPGEAIWMPAGNLHAYLRGAGIELMAASDNVLRGGFTPKRIDVGELLRVLRFEVLDDPLLPSTEIAPGILTWRVPVPDFALFRIAVDGARPPTEVPAAGPRIIIAVEGDLFAGAAVDGTPVELAAGSAAYAPAETGRIKIAGDGVAFVAAVP